MFNPSFPKQVLLKNKKPSDIIKLTKAQEITFLGFFQIFSQLDNKVKKLVEQYVLSSIQFVPELDNDYMIQTLKDINLFKTSPGKIIQYTKRNIIALGLIALGVFSVSSSMTFYNECHQDKKQSQTHAFKPVFNANQTIKQRLTEEIRYGQDMTLLNQNRQSQNYKSGLSKSTQIQIINGQFTAKKIPLIGGVISNYLNLSSPTIPEISKDERLAMKNVQYLKKRVKQFQLKKKHLPFQQLQGQYSKALYEYNKALPRLKKQFKQCLRIPRGRLNQSQYFYSAVGHSLLILGMLGLGFDAFSDVLNHQKGNYIKYIVAVTSTFIYGYKMNIHNNYTIVLQDFLRSANEYCIHNPFYCLYYTIETIIGIVVLVFIAYVAKKVLELNT
jgi:hypothetical protein